MSRCFIAILALCAVTGATAEADLWDDIADEDFTGFTDSGRALATGSGASNGSGSAAPTPAPVAPTPAPAPAPAATNTEIKIANTMTGFTKATFTVDYQKAFITASAAELKVDASKVTLTNFADKTTSRRLSAGRRLATSVTFDTVITLTAAELKATPTLLATVEAKAVALAKPAGAALLVTAFVAEQTTQSLPVKTPTITSQAPVIVLPHDHAHDHDAAGSKAWIAAPVIVILGAVGYMKYAGKGCFAPKTTDANIAGAAQEGSAVAHQNAL